MQRFPSQEPNDLRYESFQIELLMRFFIAGVMQGSSHGDDVLDQDYRDRIRVSLEQGFPQADVYDPWAEHKESMAYSDAEGKRVFLEHNQLCCEVDVVVAYIPQASMGTAIEMWEAFRSGRKVISISPMKHNWAIKFLSIHRFGTLDEFEAAVNSGELASLLQSENSGNNAGPL